MIGVAGIRGSAVFLELSECRRKGMIALEAHCAGCLHPLFHACYTTTDILTAEVSEVG